MLALGGFTSKILGAVYRIPLLNIIGAEGMGIYQLVFPLYSLLLVISSSSLPIIISKKVAELYANDLGGQVANYIKKCLVWYGFIGLILTVLMALTSGLFSSFQGEPRAMVAYIALSPSVFLVCIISVLRGYFQGRESMIETAISQVIEQLVKLSLGLVFAVNMTNNANNISSIVAMLALSITISELIALVFLGIRYTFKREKTRGNTTVKIKSSVKSTLLVTIGAIILPISQLIDSILVVNILSLYLDNAVDLYGILTGGVMSIVNLPIGIIYSLAVSIIPRIASVQNEQKSEVAIMSIKITAMLSTLACLAYLLFGSIIIDLLFKIEQAEIMKLMLRYLSPTIITLSMTQIFAFCLYSKNLYKLPAISMAVAVCVKIVLNICLLSMPQVNIFGAIISANVCFLLATILNFIHVFHAKIILIQKKKTSV